MKNHTLILPSKLRNFNSQVLGIMLMTFCFVNSQLNGQTVVVNPASPWTVPATVTTVTVSCWGGGGGGGGGTSSGAFGTDGGGGGGGAFATSVFTVTSGQTYTITVGNGGAGGASTGGNGATGGSSTVTGLAGTVIAVGGKGGTAVAQCNGVAGAGGLASACTPTTGAFSGGNGADGYGYYCQQTGYEDGGGGGGGAGNAGSGVNVSPTAAPSAGPSTGGAGGPGSPNAAPFKGGAGGTYTAVMAANWNGQGTPGTAPGGGGAGSAAAGSGYISYTGGAGGAGQVVLSYNLPVFSITSISPASGCPGSTITINGVNLSAATAITIGGVAVASITSNTATQIVAVVGSSGTGAVAVTNSNGTTSSPTNFTVITAPAQPSAITGGPSVCANSTNTFSVPAVAGATSYTWTLPGTWSGTSTTNSISAGADVNGGTVSVIANNACFSSSAQSATITINTVPSAPSAINGNTTVCQSSSQSFSIGAVANSTSYTWTLPGGWSGTSTSTSINSTIGSASGSISVTANNTCGSSTAQTQSVIVNPLPATPSAIAGNNTVCSSTSQVYYVNAAANATSYTWTIPGTWTGTSTTDSITVNTGNTGGTVSVVSNNGCGTSSVQSQVIAVTAIPSTPVSISGSTSLCSSTASSYSVTPVGGATSYTWTLPSGWSGSSSTNSINATTGSTGGTVFVTADNACGSSPAQSVSVTVSSTATTPAVISGPNTVCAGNASYTVLSDPNATSYTWTLPGGWSGTSTTDSIYAIVGTNPGTVSVVVNSNCGSSSPQTLNVSLGIPPAQPSSMLGVTHLCDSSSTAYAVTNDPNATGYTWTLPSGWSGTSNTNTITATASTTSGVISVTADNACGSSAPSTLNVVGNTIPVVTIAAFGRVCDNLSAFALSGGSPTGGTYSGTGVNSNTFDPSISGDGTYFITYTYANGACVRSDSAAITVDNCTGINSNSTSNNISLYPNPFNEFTTVSFGSSLKISNAEILIYDVLGKEVMRITNINNYSVRIEKKELHTGIYFIKVINNNSVISTLKLIIE